MSKVLPVDHGPALPPIKPEPGHTTCSVCGSPAVRLHCADCKTTFYCSLACQRVDFVGHSHTCDGFRNAPTQPLGTAASSSPKSEPDQLDQPRQHGQDSLHFAGLPPDFDPSDPQSERERAAIRDLLNVPAIEIPVWDRQREPIALNRKLMPHQHVGLTWLLNQERSPLKGGILADDMGLGKTIQALALILCHPPQDGTRKTTLIVIPNSLLRQWEREIDDKVKPGHKLKTVIYHSTKKKSMTVAKLLSYDIVLTTYGTLAFEWKQVYDNRKPDAAVLLASHAIFHRVILDEAHNIKNRNSQASKAVDRLRATYRLCMTGTPLMNRLDELYPLVRFLRVEPYRDLARFRKIAGSRSMKQLHVLLGRILLRRTEKTIVDGEPILSLPELTVQTVEVVFDKDQEDYYRALEERSQLRMNRFLKEGTVLRNYWYILLLILRLRQCCCHPYLIKDHAIPEGVDMTPEDMIKLARKLTKPVVDRIKRQKTFECPMCHENTESPIIIYPCGHYVCGDCITNMVSVREPGWMEAEDDEDGAPMGQCPAEGCTKSVDSKHVICHRYFNEVHISSGDEAYRSASTSDEEGLDEDDADDKGNLKDFVVSDDHDSSDSEEYDGTPRSTGESSSKKLLDSTRPSINSDADDSDDSLPPIDSYFAHIKKKTDPSQDARHEKRDSNERHPSKIQMEDATNHSRKSVRDIASEDSSASSGQKRKAPSGKAIAKPRKKLKKGKKKRTELTLSALRKSGSNSAAAKEQYFKGLRKDWETSAKIDKAMELLGMIRRDFPNEKTLVFSQFTSFLDLMEIPISDDGYNYRRYDGSMSNGDREAAVDDFMGKKEVKIMLVSLRCGNAGLNLYAATRVIMLDPFWNPSVEDQAIKRAHRMGQTNPVIAYRLLVSETVEDRIIALQESKRQLVSDVLNPEARKGVSRLSVREIAGLFGIQWTG
ncbi:SNF2 family N-terminal domain-containing protein [Xylaria flabelliformis]|nr:SNF2 family N-terminal domain-containing protein [Xylaria flabelliformis]